MSYASTDTRARPRELTQAKPTSSLYIIGMLSLVSTICGLVIVLAYQVTMQPIARNLAIITNEAVSQVVPGGAKQVIYALQPDGGLKAVPDTSGKSQKLFAVYDDAGKLLGVAVETAGPGYGDLIRLMYAYSPEKQAITGFKVLDAKETPGLGDKIGTDPGFLANFQDLDVKLSGGKLANPIQTVKHGTKSNPWEIDGISGATVSSNAVGNIINDSAEKMIPLIRQNLEKIRGGANE